MTLILSAGAWKDRVQVDEVIGGDRHLIHPETARLWADSLKGRPDPQLRRFAGELSEAARQAERHQLGPAAMALPSPLLWDGVDGAVALEAGRVYE
jgi:hypothetical protein